jgi:putative flavoprotein involved in K+ transport
MDTTNTIIIGGGQAGLALSRCLSDRDHDHLVLERGRVAERWRSERWDSLRLLTPNWMTRLPGGSYAGPDPDGFMTAAEVTTFFEQYAGSFRAPLVEHTSVRRVEHHDGQFVVTADEATFQARNVVIATGWCDKPVRPPAADDLSPAIHQIVPTHYRRPDDLPAGGVLVVGASATGVQLDDEIHRSGRPVTLAVGSHSRMPRRYRGLDTFWWLDQIGAFDRTVDDVDDPFEARREPSLQLVGRPDNAALDLATLQSSGVRLVGRVLGIDGPIVSLGGDVAQVIAEADQRMRQLLQRIDAAVDDLGLRAEVLDPEPIATTTAIDAPRSLDLARAGITTVLWATGYRRAYDWLRLPIIERGEIRQRRGVTAVPGAYVLGQRFQHHRNSNFIDGVGRDAEFVAEHLGARTRAAHPSASCSHPPQRLAPKCPTT